MSCGNFSKCKYSFVLCFVILLASCFLSSAASSDEGNKVWSEFRSKFPEPFRTIACQQSVDGSRVYIISEPPENVTVDIVDKIFDGFVHRIWTRTSQIGYDGLMKDIVVYTDGIPTPSHDQIVLDLNNLVYGTTHKASCLPLPYTGNGRPFFYDKDYNIKVNDRCLHDLTLNYNGNFRNLQSSSTMLLSEIISKKEHGTYLSLADDIVILTLPYRGDVSDAESQFHIFALESDFLLGAVYSSEIVMVVGRRRKTDLVSVPPLRSDEMLMLAAAENQIGQSLSITGPVFSKVREFYDWCPAWISDNISQSEYAYLLTATDNYLKLWLSYDDYELWGFNNSRPPVKFDSSLLEGLSKIYNWNTRDYVKATAYHNGIICHFNNIGCLDCKIIDLTDGVSRSHINKAAYEFLKNSHSSEIFRVAQYTMLYEIFRFFNITANRYKRPSSTATADLPFLSSATRILTGVKELSDFDIDNIATAIYRNEIMPQFSKFSDQEKADFVKDEPSVKQESEQWEQALKTIVEEEAKESGISPEQYRLTESYKILREKTNDKIIKSGTGYFDVLRRDLEKDYCIQLIESIEQSRDKLKTLSTDSFNHFCTYCASPDAYQNNDRDLMESIEKSLDFRFILSRYSRYFGYNINQMFEDYVEHHRGEGRKWFKAPSVVLINNKQNFTLVKKSLRLQNSSVIGGHSIYPYFTETPPSTMQEGRHILKLSGNPVEDAWFYGQKAMHAPSHHDMIVYIRQSREAMSQAVKPGMKLNQYDNLYEKIEKSLNSAINSVGPRRILKSEIINDFNEVKAIVETELTNTNLSEKDKESYQFIQEVAEREINRFAQPKLSNNIPPSRQKTSSKEVFHKTSENTAANLKEGTKKMQETEEILETDEIKELRRRLRNLQMTLTELKRKK